MDVDGVCGAVVWIFRPSTRVFVFLGKAEAHAGQQSDIKVRPALSSKWLPARIVVVSRRVVTAENRSSTS